MNITRLRRRRGLPLFQEVKAGPGVDRGSAFGVPFGSSKTRITRV